MALIQRVAARAAVRQSSSSYAPSLLCNKQRQTQMLIQTRSKRSAAAGKKNKKAISRAITSNQRSAKSSTTGSSTEGEMVEAIFGLRPIDYSVVPPIRYSPAPPPPKPGFQKYLFPLTLAFTAATVVYFYVNNKNDNYAYWEAMQSGVALQLDEDDDDDDDYEDDEEE